MLVGEKGPEVPEVKENSKGIKSILGRIAILDSVAKKGLPNKTTFENMPEVRAIYVQIVYVGEMHSKKREG